MKKKKEEERKIQSCYSVNIFSSSFWRSLPSTPAPSYSRADFQCHVCLYTYLQLDRGHENGKGGQMVATAHSLSSVVKDHMAPFIRPDWLIPEDTKRLFVFPYHLERKLLVHETLSFKIWSFSHIHAHIHVCMLTHNEILFNHKKWNNAICNTDSLCVETKK